MPRHPSLIAGPLAALLLATAPAAGDGVAGAFDFYVLSLSWSPGECAADAAADDDDPAECVRAHGFVVHGLWPEYENGWPEYCASSLAGALTGAAGAAIADIMPNAALAAHEWRRHGLCSGLSQARYFAVMREAVARVAIPKAFVGDDQPRRLSPRAIEAAFAAANPGLKDDALSVQCRGGLLTGVRVCLTKDLAFRRCVAVDADSCRAGSIAIPTGE